MVPQSHGGMCDTPRGPVRCGLRIREDLLPALERYVIPGIGGSRIANRAGFVVCCKRMDNPRPGMASVRRGRKSVGRQSV